MPGIVAIGRASASVAEKKSGRIMSPGSTDVSRASARMAGDWRRRRGGATGNGMRQGIARRGASGSVSMGEDAHGGGKVYLLGAGPGDPGTISLTDVRALGRA